MNLLPVKTEPVTCFGGVRTLRKQQTPKTRTVIEMTQVRNFMGSHIVKDILRRQDKSPGE
jgi:hypothetical protein